MRISQEQPESGHHQDDGPHGLGAGHRWHNVLEQGLPRERWRRWSGLGLATLLVVTAGSVLMRKRSVEAYVTTDVVTISSPIQGVVTAQAVSAGQQFERNTALIAVEAGRRETAQLQAIELQLHETEAEIKATDQSLLHTQMVNRARLKEEVITAERMLNELQAQHNRYQTQAQRYRLLVEAGAMDNDSLVGAQAMATSYLERLRNQKDLLKSLRQEAYSAQIHQNQRSARISSARRMEAMEIEMGRLAGRLEELQAKREELKRERASLKQQASFIYKPRFHGQILTTRFSVGDEVNTSSVLLTAVNCEKFRVEALFISSKLRDLHLGQKVRVHWPISKTSATGVIVSMRGEQGLTGLESTGGARFRPANVDRSRLMIALPAESHLANGCRLGERVRVDL